MSGFPPIALLTADAPSILPEFGPPQWGIFDENGGPVLISDSVGGLDYERSYDVSNYPQEQGAFESYNKVQEPYESKLTLLSSQTRQELLATIEPIVASLQLVTIVMPEFSYQSANLTRYKFRRTSQSGVTLVAVDVWCREIRFPTTSTLSSNSSASTSAPAAQQQGSPGGASQPVGQVSLGGSPSSSALTTGSTNAASPTSSGPVQPVGPSGGGAPGSGSYVTPLAPF
jgi:hypothetical protein